MIAYGNPLRGDDGIGPRVADRLEALERSGHVEMVVRHQLTPELADPISRAERVIFVDACVGQTAGAIIISPVQPASPASALTHQTTPESLLASAAELYGAAPPAVVVTVCGGNFEFGEQLSPEVEAALPRLADEIRALIVGEPDHA